MLLVSLFIFLSGLLQLPFLLGCVCFRLWLCSSIVLTIFINQHYNFEFYVILTFDFSFSFAFFVFFFLLNVNLQVLKDATQGSEPGKTISLYVLDALICIDHERFFLSQLQSRGFLRSCFMSISNVSYQVFFLSAIFSQLIHDILPYHAL